jgi:quinol-cytochrome oxidoreductase complex cytochrome b subunit
MKIEPFYTLNQMRKEHGVMRTIAIKLNESVERFTAGLDINAVRGVLRGDPAPKPNPRVKPHTEGAIFHMWPTFYHKAVTGLWPTLRLGMISTILFLIEIITGLFLMLWYTPSPTAAYSDMLRILSNVPLGELTRDIHRLAAEFMVFFVAMHMWRTYITGSYKKPRQFTYFTGVVLLLMTILLSYTGYLLPWDQLALWAVTIGASMADAAPPPQVGEAVGLLLRGGLEIGANGLLRFYLLHVFALPLILILFLFVHYYKVVRHGHSLPPSLETKSGEDTARRVSPNLRVPFLPDIFTSEIFWLGLITAVMVVGSAFFYDAPLESHADHTNTPLHTVAPWYFLWIQGMLKLGDKTIWGVIVPTVFLLAHFFLGYIDYNPSRQYRDRKIALSVSLFTVGAIVVLSFMGTSAYLVNSPFEVEVGFEFMRPEKIGEHDVRNVPFEELMPGEYDTAAIDPALEGDAPHLYEALQGLRAQIDRYSAPNLAKNLAGGHAIVTITDWTKDADGLPNLRRVQMSVEWPRMPIAEDGTPQPYEKYVYVHRDAIHPSE